MLDRWSDGEARRTVEAFAAQGVREELALRVYTTRLLGVEPKLVLHGGGNTSVKSRLTDDLTGEELDVLFVKGSGREMATIDPTGLPAVRLGPLLAAASLESLSDEDMVRLQRRNLLDPGAPNPSVETLLHAWLPHRFIDHTHANAVLALTDQPEGESICRDVFGARAPIVPYVPPGFELARAASQAIEAHPAAEGMILLKHGIFSFGETAREAYERMIRLVGLAEERVRAAPERPFVRADLPAELARPAEIAPVIRGALALSGEGEEAGYRRFVLDFRTSSEVLAFVDGAEVDRYARAGTVTPDHVIRTKPWPVVLPSPAAGAPEEFAGAARAAVRAYETRYRAYFDRHNERHGGAKRPLDPSPRVVLVPGIGLFAAGVDAKAAAVAADLAETAAEVITAAESVGAFESLTEAELFDMEYWSLEQAKLGAGKERPLARHVVAVTGGAGAIGSATAAEFRSVGAEVALLDLPGEPLHAAAERLGALAVECDVTEDGSVECAFDAIATAYGGLDVLVSNAGAAWRGRIGEVPDETLRRSFELNFFGHQRVARAAVEIFLAQGTGGVLLFNVTKQAVNPGPDFGPYGLPKAATLALVRQYAVDYGRDGVRSNGVNADRVRSGLLTDALVAARAAARGLTEAEYLRGNLLGREVEAKDVAQAFVALALARSTTGAILTVDGGNIAAALR